MFSTYHEETVMTSNGNIYLLQYGSYINKDVMEENITKLDYYLILEEDNKYYVYLGVFTNLVLAKEMQSLFENRGIYTYLKNDYLGDSEIITKIKEQEDEWEKSTNKDNLNQKILEILKNVN